MNNELLQKENRLGKPQGWIPIDALHSIWHCIYIWDSLYKRYDTFDPLWVLRGSVWLFWSILNCLERCLFCVCVIYFLFELLSFLFLFYFYFLGDFHLSFESECCYGLFTVETWTFQMVTIGSLRCIPFISCSSCSHILVTPLLLLNWLYSLLFYLWCVWFYLCI